MGKHGVIAPGGVENPPNAKAITQVEGAAAYSIIPFCYVFIIIYTLTLAPVTWVYAVEAWSLGTRATSMTFVAVSNWLSDWTLGCFVPPALRNITYKLFVIFGVLCSLPRFKPSLRILKRVGRLWRRLSCCLGRMDQGLVGQNPVGVGLIRSLRLLLRERRGRGLYKNRPGVREWEVRRRLSGLCIWGSRLGKEAVVWGTKYERRA